MVKTKEVMTDDCYSVDYSSLGKVVRIISVKKDGENVRFYDLPFHLYMPEPRQKYVVEYEVR